MSNDAASPIVKKLFSTREELLVAFSDNYFYLELMLDGVAILFAGLLAYAVRFRVGVYLKNKPHQRIDKEFIIKPISLLFPLLTYLFLNIVKPIAVEYTKNSEITNAAIKLCVFYIVAKFVLLIVQSQPVAKFIAIVIMVTALLDVSGFMKLTTSYLSSMSFGGGEFKISVLNLIHGIIILVVVLWMAGLLSRALESYLRRSSSLSFNARVLIVKFAKLFIYFIALMIALSVAGVNLTAFAVFGGALGVGIGLGLQKVTANFLSGITLLLEKSIMIGDLIEVGGNLGHVREMNVRYALVETFDGRELLVPNEELTSTRVTNWTHSNDQARIEVKLILDFNTDAKLAVKYILECAKSHPSCIKNPAPVCWLREFSDIGLVFVLAFWIPNVHEGRNASQSEVMLAILDVLHSEKITFARLPILVPNKV